MIGRTFIYGSAVFACNWVLITGTLLSPLMKVEPVSTLNLYKSEGAVGPMSEYDYTIVKRAPQQDTQDTPDSKERRSQMGSSFIRFGRGRLGTGNLENADYNGIAGNGIDGELDARMARGRSDVIIRFGRADPKNFGTSRLLARGDLAKLLEWGKSRHAKKPLQRATYRSSYTDRLDANDLDRVSIVCSDVLAGVGSSGDDSTSYDLVEPGNFYLAGKLVRLCNSLGLGIVENDEDNRRAVRSKIVEILENAASEAQAGTVKRE